MSLDLCAGLYGGDELDEEITRNYIPPVSAFDGIADRYLLATAMNRNKEQVKVISECGCVGVKKILHHPNKDDPFTVQRMCLTCHSKEHRQMRNNEKLLLVSMLAAKLLIGRGERRKQ